MIFMNPDPQEDNELMMDDDSLKEALNEFESHCKQSGLYQ